MTTPFIRAVYELAGQVRASATISDANKAMDGSENLFLSMLGRNAEVWAVAKDSGLIDVLMTGLSKPQLDLPSFSMFMYRGIAALIPCILAGSCCSLTDDEQDALFIRIIPMFHTFFSTATEVRNYPDPAAPTVLHMVQTGTVMFAGQLFRGFNFDKRLIDPIDKEGVLCAVFDVLFSPRSPPDDASRQNDVKCCSLALAANIFQFYPYQVRKILAVENAIQLYGPTKIAQECALLANNPDPAIYEMGVCNIIELFHHQKYPGISEAFIRNGVHSAITQAYWRERKTSLLRDDGSIKLFMLTHLLTNAFKHGGYGTRSPVVIGMSELLKNEDLLLFIANILVGFTFRDPEYVNDFTTRVRELAACMLMVIGLNPTLVAQQYKADWSRVMLNLLHLERCHPPKSPQDLGGMKFAVEQWRCLGKSAQFDSNIEQMGSQRRCGWIRCPVSLQNEASTSQWTMLQCSGCRKTQYCTESCQRRDWKSGHQATCAISAR